MGLNKNVHEEKNCSENCISNKLVGQKRNKFLCSSEGPCIEGLAEEKKTFHFS